MKQPPVTRRRFQFSLATLFWLMVFAATSVYAFRQHRERARLDAKLAARNAVTVGLSAPGVIGGGLDVPFTQDSDTPSEASP